MRTNGFPIACIKHILRVVVPSSSLQEGTLFMSNFTNENKCRLSNSNIARGREQHHHPPGHDTSLACTFRLLAGRSAIACSWCSPPRFVSLLLHQANCGIVPKPVRRQFDRGEMEFYFGSLLFFPLIFGGRVRLKDRQ